MQNFFSERATALELIDGHVDSAAELAESFRDIAFANRRFGGVSAVLSALRGLNVRTILDVGAGICDIPAELRRRSPQLRITCLDNNPELLNIARSRYGADPGLTFVAGDGKALPFEDSAFDVAMCNLALHHFDPADAVTMLAELRRVSRITPLVTDLQRSAHTFLTVLVFSRLFSANRLTRHDGPLSARRAYTPAEAMVLAGLAGWNSPQVRTHRLIRLVLRDAAV